MAFETDSEHIEHFALQPVRAGKPIGKSGCYLVDLHLLDNALVPFKAIENVDQIEARAAVFIINRGQIYQEVVVRTQPTV